jgi:hypothetical protein
MAVTYVDVVGAVRAWINSRTALVGLGRPLQKGAHFKRLDGAADATYALLTEAASYRSPNAPEAPDMMAVIDAQVYGGTREEATTAAVALAEELSTGLAGIPAAVPDASLQVADDFTGPLWAPDNETPRLTLTFTVRIRPA